MNSAEDVVAQVFGPGGSLSRSHPGYECRPGQIELTRAVYRVIEAGGHLVAEAPCGLGKTYASIMPLAAFAHARKAEASEEGCAVGPMCIATATIALQEQLVNKDIPAITGILPWECRFALLKGRGNYLCLRKFRRARHEGHLRVREVERWSDTTTTGDRSEFPGEMLDEEWHEFASDAGECWYGGCEEKTKCYADLARRIALEADVVVTNYHALLAGGGKTLGAMSSIIFDEAHELPRLARELLGWSVTARDVSRVGELLDEVRGEHVVAGLQDSKQLAELAERSFMRVVPLLEEHGQDALRVRRPGEIDMRELGGIVKSIAAAAEGMRTDTGDKRLSGLIRLLRKRASDLEWRLTCVSEAHDRDHWVYWAQQRTGRKGKTYVSLEGRPFRVSEILRGAVFDPHDHPAVVLMSATMRTSTGFDFIRRESGVPDSARELVVDSPFKMHKQAALVVPSFVRPLPRFGSDRADVERSLDEVAVAAGVLIRAMGGRTLCLFSSWEALRHVYRRLAELPQLKPYRLLKQGDAPTQRLVKQFTDDETSVLLGVVSLWQGIDVPGDSLKGLFIHKLPFPAPREPVTEAMTEYLDESYGSGASFFMWSLPLATIALQQGMGRLIRSTTDTGVIVVADQRLMKSSYGKKIRRVLPRFSQFTDFETAKLRLPHLFEHGGQRGA